MQLTMFHAECLSVVYARIVSESWGMGNWNKMIQDSYLMGFTEAPASSQHHLSVTGGLFLHSIGVVERALKLRVGMTGIPHWKVILAGLIHDVGKCGLLCDGIIKPRYVSNTQGRGYTVYKAVPDFTVRDLSALYAQKWGAPWDVVQAVLTHDGLYSEQNRPYIDSQNNLSKLISTADYLQSQIYETKDTAFLALAEGIESGVEQAGVAEGGGDTRISTPSYRVYRTPPLKRKIGRFNRK